MTDLLGLPVVPAGSASDSAASAPSSEAPVSQLEVAYYALVEAVRAVAHCHGETNATAKGHVRLRQALEFLDSLPSDPA